MYYRYPESACLLVGKQHAWDLEQLLGSNNGARHDTLSGTTRNVELDEPIKSSRLSVGETNGKDSESWNGTLVRRTIELFKFNSLSDATLLGCLQNLFVAISTQKKRSGVMGPRQFVTKLKQENGLLYN
jgi:hypothetical protein